MGLAGVSCSADPCLSVRIAELPTGSSRQSAGPAKANKLFYENATGYKEIWDVLGSGHMKGIDAQPQEYERRGGFR